MTLETLKIEFQAETGGVEQRLSALGQSLNGFADSLSATVDSAKSVGTLASSGFAAGISQGVSGARQATASVLKVAKFSDAATVSSAKQAGGALATGFAQGISGKSSAAYTAVKRMVNQSMQLVRSLLGIHSPSKVAASFGGYFGEGFAQGIQGSISRVAGASTHLAEAAGSGLNASLPREVREGASNTTAAAVNAALNDMNITIPLNVDGMKLGEASIRGINAVTRSSGRLLLNI